MLPSTGYFKGITCPFFESGLCERPYCHFRHVRRDPEINNEALENPEIFQQLVSEAVKKALLQSEGSGGDIAIKSQSIISQVVEELKPSSFNIQSDTPPQKATYNPTPIAELNKLIPGTNAEVRSVSKHENRRHIPVPYTPHRPSRTQLSRLPVKLDSGSALSMSVQEACAINSMEVDQNKYTPSAIESENSVKYLPGSLGNNPTPYSPIGQSSNKESVSYTPSNLSGEHVPPTVCGYSPVGQGTSSGVTYKPGTVKASASNSYCPTNNSTLDQLNKKPSSTYSSKFNYKPTPLNKQPSQSPTFSSDEEEEPDVKKIKLNDTDELDGLDLEFQMLDEILEDENNASVNKTKQIDNEKIIDNNTTAHVNNNNSDVVIEKLSPKQSENKTSSKIHSNKSQHLSSDNKTSKNESRQECSTSKTDHKHSSKKKDEDVSKERDKTSKHKSSLIDTKISKDKTKENKHRDSSNKDSSHKDRNSSHKSKDDSHRKSSSDIEKKESSDDKKRSKSSSSHKDSSQKHNKDKISKSSCSSSSRRNSKSEDGKTEKHSHSKSSSRHESKSDSKHESKADSKNESKSDGKHESKSSSKHESKTSSKHESKSNSKHENKTESKHKKDDKSHRSSLSSKHSSKDKSNSSSHKKDSHSIKRTHSGESKTKHVKEVDLFSISVSDDSGDEKMSDNDSANDVVEIFSESDEESITQECLKIFQEYTPTAKETSTIDTTNKQVDSEEDASQASGKKRVAHSTNLTIYRTPSTTTPNHKAKALQMVTDRYSKVKKFHEERSNAKLPETETVQSPLNEPSVSYPPPSGSKVRIAHVPYATTLISAKKALKVPETPPPPTPVQTVAKGSNRVAHMPNDKFSDRPTPLEPMASKVPINIRSNYLNMMIDECLKIYLTAEDAYERALQEELCTNKKCNTIGIYKNSALLTISRLRKEIKEADGKKISSNNKSISHSKVMLGKKGETVSWSIENKYKKHESEIANELKGKRFYENISKWILDEEQLQENGFPRPHPEKKEKGWAKIYRKNTKQKPPKGFTRTCNRCQKEYDVDKKGLAIRKEECIYHPNNKYRYRGEVKYQCCSQDGTSDGCLSASCHVFEYVDVDNLRGYVKTLPKEDESFDHGVYALDCEMCYTTNGLDLTRVTVINSNLKVVYESLVKPIYPIIDYNTKFSGITEQQMKNVTTSLLEVQATLLHMFSDKTILVGHSLESDFKALKLIHNTVVDTSVLFPHKMGPPYKRALRNLASEYLKKIIQNSLDGHDSAEDALVCMELLIWKVKEELKMK